jgi:hypothetical protein
MQSLKLRRALTSFAVLLAALLLEQAAVADPDMAALKTLQAMGVPFTPQGYYEAVATCNEAALPLFLKAGMSPNARSVVGMFIASVAQHECPDDWPQVLKELRQAGLDWKTVNPGPDAYGAQWGRPLTMEEEVLYDALILSLSPTISDRPLKADLAAGASPQSLYALYLTNYKAGKLLDSEKTEFPLLAKYARHIEKSPAPVAASTFEIRGVRLGMTKTEVLSVAAAQGMSARTGTIFLHSGEIGIELRDPKASVAMASSVGQINHLYDQAIGGYDPNAPSGLKMFVWLSSVNGRVFRIDARNAADDASEAPRDGVLYKIAVKKWGQPNEPSGVFASWEPAPRGTVEELDAGDSPERQAWDIVVIDVHAEHQNRAKTEPGPPPSPKF